MTKETDRPGNLTAKKEHGGWRMALSMKMVANGVTFRSGEGEEVFGNLKLAVALFSNRFSKILSGTSKL